MNRPIPNEQILANFSEDIAGRARVIYHNHRGSLSIEMCIQMAMDTQIFGAASNAAGANGSPDFAKAFSEMMFRAAAQAAMGRAHPQPREPQRSQTVEEDDCIDAEFTVLEVPTTEVPEGEMPAEDLRVIVRRLQDENLALRIRLAQYEEPDNVKESGKVPNRFATNLVIHHVNGPLLYPVRMKNKITNVATFRMTPRGSGATTEKDEFEVESQDMMMRRFVEDGWAVRAQSLDRSVHGFFKLGGRSVKGYEILKGRATTP